MSYLSVVAIVVIIYLTVTLTGCVISGDSKFGYGHIKTRQRRIALLERRRYVSDNLKTHRIGHQPINPRTLKIPPTRRLPPPPPENSSLPLLPASFPKNKKKVIMAKLTIRTDSEVMSFSASSGFSFGNFEKKRCLFINDHVLGEVLDPGSQSEGLILNKVADAVIDAKDNPFGSREIIDLRNLIK